MSKKAWSKSILGWEKDSMVLRPLENGAWKVFKRGFGGKIPTDHKGVYADLSTAKIAAEFLLKV